MPKKRTYLLRVMEKGLHQKIVEGNFNPEDIRWIDICEVVEGKPFKAILSARDFETDDMGFPVRFTKNLKAIDETIWSLKVTRKIMQGKTIRSLKGIVNKIKYYFLGYILHEAIKRG